MNIIDLTLPLYHQMPVFPGDPEVEILEIHTLDKEGWNLRKLSITTHLGTHVNVPYHMTKSGMTLDDLALDRFFGESVLYNQDLKFNKNAGVVFHTQNIDVKLARQIISEKPKFVGLSARFEIDIEIERLLCENGIISYENLAHTDKLPESFVFYGVPLNIKGGDGSPVRAFAMFD